MAAARSSEFEGRTALVTGGATGIGRAICLRLAAGGARVAINYRSHDAEAAYTAAAIEKDGGEAIAVRADVAEPADVASMCRTVENELGPIALLVNNAGRFSAAAASQDTPEQMDEVLRANLRTTFVTMLAVKDSMLARQFGRVVNIASTAARRVPPHAICYGAAKAGVVALTQGWAQAWGSQNIRVNCVAPGFIDTEANAGVDGAILDRIRSDTPLQRAGSPTEAADAVAFLLSEASSFINGQTLSVCGGRVMNP